MTEEMDFCREAARRLKDWEARKTELLREFAQLETECYRRLGIRRSRASRARRLEQRQLRLVNLLDERLNGCGQRPPFS